MKAAVIRCFCDRTAAERFVPVGSTYEGTAERIAELAAGGYVEAPEPEPEPEQRRRKKRAGEVQP